MEMVDILRMFIKAERTANWELHLQVVSQMLPYFAASGHNLYTKCAYLYLQSMKSLKDKNPEVYQELVSGIWYLVCGEEDRSLMGRVIDRPYHRASPHEEPEDDWWPDTG